MLLNLAKIHTYWIWRIADDLWESEVLTEMVYMIALSAGIDQNIIYEDYDEHVQVLLEHTVHQVYESG